MAVQVPKALADAYAQNLRLLGPEAAARSLPPNWRVGAGGQLEPTPEGWLEKWGWTLPLAPMALGLFAPAAAAGAAGAGGAPAVMTGPTLAQAGLAGAGGTAAAGSGAASTAAKVASMAGSGENWKDIADLGAKLFGQLFGAHMQTAAADKSAQIAADAAKYGADKVAAAEAAALAFQKSTGENAFQNSEVGRRTDYAWQAAREKRLGYLGDLLGMPAREIPAFIPGVDPHFDTGGGSSAPGADYSGAFSPTAASNPNDPAAITAALNAYYKSVGKTPTGPGTGPTDIGYFAGRVGQTGGLTPDNINYWFGPNGRISQELAGTVKPEAAASTAGLFAPQPAARAPMMIPSFLTSTQASPILYPGSVGSFL